MAGGGKWKWLAYALDQFIKIVVSGTSIFEALVIKGESFYDVLTEAFRSPYSKLRSAMGLHSVTN